MEQRINTLRLAAWGLIILGTIETAVFVWAIVSDWEFAGGSILYIFAGISLMKKRAADYTLVLFVFTVIFSLIPAVLVIMGLASVGIATATDIPLSVSSVITKGIIFFAIYLGIVTGLVALLYHPNTRTALSLKPYHGTIHTLYMSRVRFTSVLVCSIIVGMLLVGPHLLHNPYRVIVSKTTESKLVANHVGKIKKLELISTGEYNWKVVSIWKVFGTKSEYKYKTVLGLDSEFTVESYDKDL